MEYQFHWSVLWEYRHLLWIGLKTTLEVSAISLILSLVLGTLVGVGRLSHNAYIRILCTSFVEFFRNIPLIVLLFFFYFAVGLHSFSGSIVGLSTYTAAFIAEIVRSGLQSVPKGHFEAAKSTGLTSYQTLRYVTLPHVFMITIPPLSNEFLNLVKNSSVCMTIALTELTFQTQEIDALTFRGFEAATGITLIYIGITLAVAGIMNRIEKKMNIRTRVG
jgi:polar amino acid transport system permease protein